jgi:tRNA pseudouridine32 synthase/23S rRNA pseudouridine746 synthase
LTPTPLLAEANEIPAGFVPPSAAPPVPAARGAAVLARELDVTMADIDWFAPGAGKMFGVLVVRDAQGEVGFLRGFSGMVGGRWFIDGFAPPLFDVAARDAFWPAGEAELGVMTHRIGETTGTERRALVLRRRARSRELWAELMRTYRCADAKGVVRTVEELFAPAVAPGGAGDCAGPKLVGAAHALGLQPLALAEIWWGAPSRDGSVERTHRSFHAPCDRKCGPVLAHMLR